MSNVVFTMSGPSTRPVTPNTATYPDGWATLALTPTITNTHLDGGLVGHTPNDNGPYGHRGGTVAALPPTRAVNPLGGFTAPPTDDDRRHYTLFGFSVTSVLKFMGKAGLNCKQARHVLNVAGLQAVANNTIATQLYCGKKGQRGKPAPLTDDHIDQLEQMLTCQVA